MAMPDGGDKAGSERMQRSGNLCLAPVAGGAAVEAVGPVIERFHHPALDDLGERPAPERAIALGPLQADRLHRLHQSKGHE